MNEEREQTTNDRARGEGLPSHSRRASLSGRPVSPPRGNRAVDQLRAVAEGIAAIAAPVAGSVDELLSRIAATAIELTGARYCALGIGTDPERQFDPWVFIGMSDEEARAIGRAPRPVCMLGAVPRLGRTIRTANLQEAAEFCGFPANHPPMRSFLGVPIKVEDRSIGNLYLTDKVGASEFSEEDQLIVEALAVHAGVAVESARLYEEAHRRAAELEQERRERETFISVVSHELRGPLSVLIGYSDLLPMWEQLPAARREIALRAIGDQARLMNRLIGDLLDTSRIQTGRFQVEPATFDLAEVILRVAEAQRATAGDRSVHVEAPARLTAWADEARVSQALTNIIGNAIKYSPDGSRIQVRLAEDGGFAHVGVSDEGIGIPDDQIPALFQPYSRLNHRDQVAKGIGLGLYITRGIVEAHGGRIWAESAGPDRGTTIHFTLPLEPPHQTGAQ